MGVKILKLNISRGSTRRHALFRALIVASALSIVPLIELLPGKDIATKNHVSGGHTAVDLVDLGQFLFPGPKPLFSKLVEPFLGKIETENCPKTVIADAIAELMELKLLHYDAKILCIGRGSDSAVSVFKEMGISDVHKVPRHPLFAFSRRNHIYEIKLNENSFDFVFCGDLDKVTSPAHLVLEMERVLKPGGTGTILVSTMNGSVKSTTSISLWLSQSEIVHVNYMDEFTVIVFTKNPTKIVSYFEKTQLPGECQSVENNRPYIGLMEPLLKQKPDDFPKSVAYLPNFRDLSLKKRLVYIDIGAAEHMDAKLTQNWFLPSYPIDSKAFKVYFVDHNTSVMLSYVKKPGVTFIYHPGLAGNNRPGKEITPQEELEPLPEDEGFDFLAWFVETTKCMDFVILKMNTNEIEMNFLSVLMETGAICCVDELFLRCSNQSDCINTILTLRSRGVFVHQWWGD